VGASLMGLWVRIPPKAWMSVSREWCCQAEVSATGRSFVRRSSTERGVPECDLETSKVRRPRSTRIVEP
jgi:hypothetical protein